MKFEIELVQERTYYDYATVIVEADSQGDAETAAIAMAEAFKVGWTEGDVEHTSFDVTGSEELK
jgi:hypothetical protein